MKTAKTVFWLLVAAALASGCSKSGDSSNGSGGSAGTGGNDASTLAQELCPAACATVKTCHDAAEQNACETQCAKELEGDGYLFPDFAKVYFQKLKDVGTDTSCSVTDLKLWFASDAVAEGVDESILKPCEDNILNCVGQPDVNGATCLTIYYIFNIPFREKAKACYALACNAQEACLCEATTPWLAWVGIPRDPNDIFHAKCPPPT